MARVEAAVGTAQWKGAAVKFQVWCPSLGEGDHDAIEVHAAGRAIAAVKMARVDHEAVPLLEIMYAVRGADGDTTLVHVERFGAEFYPSYVRTGPVSSSGVDGNVDGAHGEVEVMR